MFPGKEDPLLILMDAMLDKDKPGGAGAIERQEARGQQILVSSDVLPRKINSGTRQQFEQMGVVFGEYADGLFVYVTLPPGWKKESTSHSMWSKLVDDKGRERASIFYKAAFYDRDASMSIDRRYTYGSQPALGWDHPQYKTMGYVGVVKDCGNIIWKSEEIEPEPPYNRDDSSLWRTWSNKKDELDKIARHWLSDHFRDWENPLAYWD